LPLALSNLKVNVGLPQSLGHVEHGLKEGAKGGVSSTG
jgi:hypothetical protein